MLRSTTFTDHRAMGPNSTSAPTVGAWVSGVLAGHAQMDESAWGAVPALLLVRFPRPRAEPVMWMST